MDQLKINGLKSHDYHIFIERLLPVVMRGFVKNEIWESLAELSYFFRVLCAKEVDRAQILQLEANTPIILCKLEHIRKEAHDSKLAKDYAQSMLEWGRTVQSQFQSLQSFMEVRYDIQPSLFSFVPIELLSDYI